MPQRLEEQFSRWHKTGLRVRQQRCTKDPDSGLGGEQEHLYQKELQKVAGKRRTPWVIGGFSDSTGTGSGSGCARRGYKTFMRLLREFTEVTE